MQHFYTADYEGEVVVNTTSWRDAHKEENRVWIPKTIINEPDNLTAHVIGNGTSRSNFDLNFLKGQVGGSEGVRSVGQSYGCNALYKDFNPTFLLCFNKFLIKDLVDSNYCEDNIVYSNMKNIKEYPNNFHLYPQYYNSPTGILAAHIAAADGHQKIFLLGFDWYQTGKENIYFDEDSNVYGTVPDVNAANQKNTKTMISLINLYSEAEFIRVSTVNSAYYPEELNWCNNFRQISYSNYFSEAQLGAIAR